MLHSSSLRPRAGEIKWGDGREKRMGTKGWFQGRRALSLQEAVADCPFPCTHRAGLSNCSSEGGHGLSAAQGEELALQKLDAALPHWVLGWKRGMQPGLLHTWHCIAVLVAVNISLLSQGGAVWLRTDNSFCSSLAAVLMLREHPGQQKVQGPRAEVKNESSPTELLGRRLLLSCDSLNLSLQHSFQAKSL